MYLATQSGGSHISRSEPASNVHFSTNSLRAVTLVGSERLLKAARMVAGESSSGRSTNSLESLKIDAFWTEANSGPSQNTGL